MLPSPHLCAGFLASAQRYPDRPAAEISNQAISYGTLQRNSFRVAATLSSQNAAGSGLVGVCASRSFAGYAAVLGTLLSGAAYLPLNPNFPIARLFQIIQATGCRRFIADEAGFAILSQLLDQHSPSTIILPESSEVAQARLRWPAHRFYSNSDFPPASAFAIPEQHPETAYLLFTSGSTGTPKGVVVRHANASAMIRAVSSMYALTSADRLSQFADLTWDPSVVDMFLAWEHGACVCCPSAKETLNPHQFIRSSRVTVIHLVPSIAIAMKKMGFLKPGAYPDLRYIQLGGEPLPAELVQALQISAPNAVIDNIYGATEYCIFSIYRWNPERTPAESHLGIVPLGLPLPGGTFRVLGDDLQEVPAGQEGDLYISGPQLFQGYWNDPQRDSEVLVKIDGQRFYRMGDRVIRPLPGEPLKFVGRRDQQIKLNGIRVELGEVEAALRLHAGVERAIAFGWPLSETGARGITAFLPDTAPDPSTLLDSLKQHLPSYLVPRKLHYLANFPANANGKVDRVALRNLLPTLDK